jgi:signal peptidase I
MVQKSRTREYAESLVIAAIIAFLVRGFIIQAFRIPSGSMEPTLLVGDHLLVSRMSYVVKVPFTDKVILNIGSPKKGDVIVFRYPEDRTKDFIKRVVATEGDTIQVKNKVLYVNGQRVADPHAHFAEGATVQQPSQSPRDYFGPVTVPKDRCFVMGDNRDRSLDSRYWGFVNRDDLVGRALVIYFSLDTQSDDILHYVRWERIGHLIR